MKRISDKIEALINQQIQKELTNSLLYLSMANWADYEGWTGLAELYRKHSTEELGHRDKFISYMLDRNAMPQTPSQTFDKVPNEFDGVKGILEATVKREIEATDSIKKINMQAMEEGDCLTKTFLTEMLKEQIEEEASAMNWMDRIEIYESTNSPLILLDKEFYKAAKG